MRVLSKSFRRPENGATDRYIVDLELSPQSLVEPECTATIRQQKLVETSGTLNQAPVAGHTMVLVGIYRDGSTMINNVGWTVRATGYVQHFVFGNPQVGIVVATRTARAGDTAAAPQTDAGTPATEGWAAGATGAFGIIYETDCDLNVVASAGNGPNDAASPADTYAINGGALSNVPQGALIIGGVCSRTWDVVPGASVAPAPGVTEDMDRIVAGFAPHGWAAHITDASAGATGISGTLNPDHHELPQGWGGASIALL